MSENTNLDQGTTIQRQKDLPTVTVGIPFHQGAEPWQLQIAVDSILNQSLQPTKVHLIQDGPISDKLEAVVEKYLKTSETIERITIAKNRGLPYGLNLSILRASTKYYARMDADDISFPSRLEKQVSFLERESKIDILGAWAYEFYGDKPDPNTDFLKKVPTEELDIHKFFHKRSPFIHPAVVFRREVFAKIGLYNIVFLNAQDVELWARALKLGVGVANLPEPLLYFRAGGLAKKRSSWRKVLRQAKAMYSYNTWSPYQNILKLAALGLRILPIKIREWAYRNLR